ncbi:hypothetical protein [Orenia marismortui]|uniref:hypothetical protein n=1 Tax=Orenia marismortui TaxID=46469 RepID=UPI000374DF7A|nr:hypothetical protein [Orenia marismortui]
MLKKIILVLIAIILLIFISYRYVYHPLEVKEKKKASQLAQRIRVLDNKKAELLNLNDTEIKYQKLLEKLRARNNNRLLKINDLNNFIITLNRSNLVDNIDFDLKANTKLLIKFKLAGSFKDIYKYFKSIKYIYNTEELEINKDKESINLTANLVFPMERNDD